MVAKTSWHRYGTKLRHCHLVYRPMGQMLFLFKVTRCGPLKWSTFTIHVTMSFYLWKSDFVVQRPKLHCFYLLWIFADWLRTSCGLIVQLVVGTYSNNPNLITAISTIFLLKVNYILPLCQFAFSSSVFAKLRHKIYCLIKKDPRHFSCNSSMLCFILVIFGRSISQKVNKWKNAITFHLTWLVYMHYLKTQKLHLFT